MWLERSLLLGAIALCTIFSLSQPLILPSQNSCQLWCKSDNVYYCCKDPDPSIPIHSGHCPIFDKCPILSLRKEECRQDDHCASNEKCCFDPCERHGTLDCKVAMPDGRRF